MHLSSDISGLPSVPPPPPKTIAGTDVASEYATSAISSRSIPQPHMSGILDNAHKAPEDFDIGELLQSTADLLGGQAAQAGVEIVLFHGDVGIKHTSVSGDGEGLGYALSYVSRNNPKSACICVRTADIDLTSRRSFVKSYKFVDKGTRSSSGFRSRHNHLR